MTEFDTFKVTMGTDDDPTLTELYEAYQAKLDLMKHELSVEGQRETEDFFNDNMFYDTIPADDPYFDQHNGVCE